MSTTLYAAASDNYEAIDGTVCEPCAAYIALGARSGASPSHVARIRQHRQVPGGSWFVHRTRRSSECECTACGADEPGTRYDATIVVTWS